MSNGEHGAWNRCQNSLSPLGKVSRRRQSLRDRRSALGRLPASAIGDCPTRHRQGRMRSPDMPPRACIGNRVYSRSGFCCEKGAKPSVGDLIRRCAPPSPEGKAFDSAADLSQIQQSRYKDFDVAAHYRVKICFCFMYRGKAWERRAGTRGRPYRVKTCLCTGGRPGNGGREAKEGGRPR